MTGRASPPPCDSLLISEISVRLNLLQVPASTPPAPPPSLPTLQCCVVLGGLAQSRSGDRAGKRDVKHQFFYVFSGENRMRELHAKLWEQPRFEVYSL